MDWQRSSCFKMYRWGGTSCLYKHTHTQNITAAAPQQTNQPIRTEETLINITFCCCSLSIHFSVFVSPSGCLNLFLSCYLATLTAMQYRERKEYNSIFIIVLNSRLSNITELMPNIPGGWREDHMVLICTQDMSKQKYQFNISIIRLNLIYQDRAVLSSIHWFTVCM